MVFQVIVPKQLRDIEIGRHRLQFLYQAPVAFHKVNEEANLDKIKTPAGFATVHAVEQPDRGVAAPSVAASQLRSTCLPPGAAPTRLPLDRE